MNAWYIKVKQNQLKKNYNGITFNNIYWVIDDNLIINMEFALQNTKGLQNQ